VLRPLDPGGGISRGIPRKRACRDGPCTGRHLPVGIGVTRIDGEKEGGRERKGRGGGGTFFTLPIKQQARGCSHTVCRVRPEQRGREGGHERSGLRRNGGDRLKSAPPGEGENHHKAMRSNSRRAS